MKTTTTILATLVMSLAAATAGVEPAPAPSGKGVAAPPPVDPCAGPISYNSVELLYANTDLDAGGDSGDGVQLNVEYSPMSNLYFRLGGEYATFDNADVWYIYGGIGGYIPLTENIHLAGDGGVVYADVSYDGTYATPTKGSSNDGDLDGGQTGWYLRPHLRAKWGCFELHAGATYRDLWDDSNWTYWASAYYQVAQNWDITAGYADGDDDGSVITAGVRWRY